MITNLNHSKFHIKQLTQEQNLIFLRMRASPRKGGGDTFFFKGGGNLKGGGTFLKGGDLPPLHTM